MSRKKAKGKARKAAKAKAEAMEESDAFKQLAHLKKLPCTHGWNHDDYDDSHDCYKFVETVIEVFSERKRESIDFEMFDAACKASNEKYPEILNDPTKMEWIASAFVSIGTEAFRCKDVGSSLFVYSVYFSEWIHQHVAVALHGSVPRIYSARLHELLVADERRIIGYLKKRIPCCCLDALYDKVKHLPKMGLCGSVNCSHPRERLNLARCGAVTIVVEDTTARKSAKRIIGRATKKNVKSGASGRPSIQHKLGIGCASCPACCG